MCNVGPTLNEVGWNLCGGGGFEAAEYNLIFPTDKLAISISVSSFVIFQNCRGVNSSLLAGPPWYRN